MRGYVYACEEIEKTNIGDANPSTSSMYVCVCVCVLTVYTCMRPPTFHSMCVCVYVTL